MRKWLFGILILGLLLGCVATSKFSEITATEPTPEPFQMTATYLISLATQWAEDGITPTPDWIQLAVIETITAEAPTLDAICPERTASVWQVDVGQDPVSLEIELHVEQKQESPSFCPDYERYEYYVYIWMNETTTPSQFGTMFDKVIETLMDYPPEDENAADVISLNYYNPSFYSNHLDSFPYTDAIAAYESGLRGVELLDALGIEVPE